MNEAESEEVDRDRVIQDEGEWWFGQWWRLWATGEEREDEDSNTSQLPSWAIALASSLQSAISSRFLSMVG